MCKVILMMGGMEEFQFFFFLLSFLNFHHVDYYWQLDYDVCNIYNSCASGLEISIIYTIITHSQYVGILEFFFLCIRNIKLKCLVFCWVHSLNSRNEFQFNLIGIPKRINWKYFRHNINKNIQKLNGWLFLFYYIVLLTANFRLVHFLCFD